jgi:hypothetical protein
MSKAKPTAPVKRRTVQDLLADRAPKLPELTEEQAGQVAAALKHNERTPSSKHRLSLETVHALLRDEYGFECSKHTLDQMVRVRFERKSWTAR